MMLLEYIKQKEAHKSELYLAACFLKKKWRFLFFPYICFQKKNLSMIRYQIASGVSTNTIKTLSVV